jgi:hypothetical protein
VAAFNKAGVDADKAPTEMEKDAHDIQRLEGLRRIWLIEDTFASGKFTGFDPGASEIRSAKLIASKPHDKKK